MRVLVTGGDGMLGRTLSSVMQDVELLTLGRSDVDVGDELPIDIAIRQYRPDAVIHCAAMTDVDGCERNVDQAYRVNARGSANVAAACHRNGVRLIAISTDYVFDGKLGRPYTEFDVATGGDTVYGRSKFAGEEYIRSLCPNHCICRTAWLYGKGGPSFVHKMLKLADGTRPEISVVADQRGNPTSAYALARELRALLDRPGLCGTFHMTCTGEATRAEFASEIFRAAGREQKIYPCLSYEFPRPAARPADSRLDNMCIRLSGLPAMPHWKDALAEFIDLEFTTKTERHI